MNKPTSSIRSGFSSSSSKFYIPKWLLFLHVVVSLAYFYFISTQFPIGNRWLFFALILGQAFYLWQSLAYTYTIWEIPKIKPAPRLASSPSVDIFITVAGEPVEIVASTVLAAQKIDYPNFKVYVLNDGYVANKDNWKEIETMSEIMGARCITRKIPGGAKAGNINHALKKTNGEFVLIFDADHVPYPNFLSETIGYFIDPKMAFVQTPQYYKNHEINEITAAAWEQQELFFGPICNGRNRMNAATLCGTNMILRRAALDQVGGICETNIAEDFLTGLFIHERGWKSLYLPKVLAEGLAPEDFLSYSKQQFRWARGSLEVVFKYNPLFRKGLSFGQKIQYLSSATYFLSGIFTLLNAVFPLIFFFTGHVPFLVSTMALAAVFLPYIFLTIYILRISSQHTFTFRALAFSLSAFMIHLKAAFAVLTGQKNAFSVTSKRKISGNFVNMVIPHLIYVGLVTAGMITAIIREGLSASLISNLAWALLYVSIMIPFISSAINEFGLASYFKRNKPLKQEVEI